MIDFIVTYKLEIIVLVLLLNIISFFTYMIDKKKARKGKWRISESTLLMTSFLYGALGSLFAMKIFHHKTKKAKFYILVPLFLIFQIMSVVLVIIYK